VLKVLSNTQILTFFSDYVLLEVQDLQNVLAGHRHELSEEWKFIEEKPCYWQQSHINFVNMFVD
jgi:hypothetical protein